MTTIAAPGAVSAGSQSGTLGPVTITNVIVVGEALNVALPSAQGAISVRHGFDLTTSGDLIGPSGLN